MKLLIASDIHGSAYYCRKLLEAYKKEEADKLILLGDILYHGPRNDLPEEYAPKEHRQQRGHIVTKARVEHVSCVYRPDV